MVSRAPMALQYTVQYSTVQYSTVLTVQTNKRYTDRNNCRQNVHIWGHRLIQQVQSQEDSVSAVRRLWSILVGHCSKGKALLHRITGVCDT
eukprot:1730981-Pyramimonas_sp.AAC.4